MLQQNLFETSDPSTSSAADSPAKTSALRGKGRASKASGRDSGPKWPASFGKYDLAGYWLKMYLLCEAEGPTGCSLIWKRQATPLGRLWWVLGRSGRRTNGTGCGSWPTAAATDSEAGSNGNSQSTVRSGHYHGTNLLGAATCWPTVHGNNGNNGPSGTELGNTVNRDWQTPSATCADAVATSRSGDRKDGLLLGGQVRQWGTPRVTTNGGHPSPQCTGKGSRLEDQVAENWTTPRGADANRGPNYGATENHDGGGNLLGQIKENWPTPAARDEKNPQASKATLQRNSRPLNEVAYAESSRARRTCECGHQWIADTTNDAHLRQPCPACHQIRSGEITYLYAGQPDQENPSTHGKHRGSLSSAWVMQLMGWPDEYSQELTRACLEWSETAGATRSRK